MEERLLHKEDNTKIAYSISGEGEAIVMLHGFGADRTTLVKSGWIRDLEPYYTVIAMDIRGLGESSISHDPDFYRLDRIIEDIEQVIQECGFTQFSIFGHSYGGSIALRAIKSGLPIKKAIIASGTWDAEFFHNDIPKWIIEYSEMNEKKKRKQFTDMTKEEQEWAQATDLDNYIAQFRAWTTFESVTINEITIPVFLYSGTEDEPRAIHFILDNESEFKQKLWEYKIYNGMNHSDLVREEPQIITDVLEFMERSR